MTYFREKRKRQSEEKRKRRKKGDDDTDSSDCECQPIPLIHSSFTHPLAPSKTDDGHKITPAARPPPAPKKEEVVGAGFLGELYKIKQPKGLRVRRNNIRLTLD